MDKLRRQPRWTFPLAKLEQTSPSGRDKIPLKEEIRQIAKGAKFIVSVSIQLKLPAATIYAATVYLHRFYLRYSLKQVHSYEAAGASVFLASKTEETARRIKEVAAACARIASKNPRLVLEEHSKDLLRWTDSIVYTEELLLEALFFDLEVTSPYQELNRMIAAFQVARVQEFGPLATDFINDSCRTLLSVIYPTHAIVAAAMYWTSKFLRIPIPDVDGVKWYVKEGIDRQVLVDAVNTMADQIAIARNGQVDGQPYERITVDRTKTSSAADESLKPAIDAAS